MAGSKEIILILGSGPNVTSAANWPKAKVDQIVAINNAWQVRPDWDFLVFPEDFAPERRPSGQAFKGKFIEADAFVPAQNRYGGFVHAGATMAYTAAYWVLDALRPRVMAFMGCDMDYSQPGKTHFYGNGTADPLRDDITLRDLGAKSARLALMAAVQGCTCVNLSKDRSELLFPRAEWNDLGEIGDAAPLEEGAFQAICDREAALKYETPDGRYAALAETADFESLDAIDEAWRALYAQYLSTSPV
ncbi:MAG: hypothetical protein AAF755_01930 [Pseudomonadota bacterium]